MTRKISLVAFQATASVGERVRVGISSRKHTCRIFGARANSSWTEKLFLHRTTGIVLEPALNFSPDKDKDEPFR